jgi:nucleoside-diphosphate-sugar epimerase
VKTVLVTGATGFIGRQSLPMLKAAGYRIHAVSSRPHASQDYVCWHQCDLLDPIKVEELVKRIRPSHLLHFAWYTIPGLYQESPENIRWLQASLGLTRTFVESDGQRAVFAGTCFEYDPNYGYCREELTPTRPATLYGVCKKSLHETVSALATRVGLSLAWGLIFYLYGPHEAESRLVPSVVLSLLKGGRARCSHGHQIRDFLHVKDAASAFVTILDSDVGGRVNIGSGEPVSIRSLVNLVAAKLNAVDRVDFGALPEHPKDPTFILAHIARLRDEVGWRPRCSLENGLSSAIRWWKENSQRT